MQRKKNGSLFYHILLFVMAQLAWCLLLGLWIYWFVTNYVGIENISYTGEDPLPKFGNITILVSGILLLIMITIIMSMIFTYLNRQLNLTNLYDSFIANVTHELKSPLSSIQLFLETMKKREIDRETEVKFVGNMLYDVERLDKLINSILYISSFQHNKFASKLSHDYHIYSANNVIKAGINEIFSQFRLEGSSEIKGELKGNCVIDRNWLKIVFSNLIDNAVKYSFNNRKITVRLNQSHEYYQISIEDNGIGINPKDYKKIFKRFQRLDNPLSPSVKGTGLGLYWVKEIVRYHGGKISVNSSAKKPGTVFTVFLPVYKSSKRRYINKLLKLSIKSRKESLSNAE